MAAISKLPAMHGKQAAVFCTFALNPRKTLDKLTGVVRASGADVIGGLALHRAKIDEHAETFADPPRRRRRPARLTPRPRPEGQPGRSGRLTRPWNSTAPVSVVRTANRNGRSNTTDGGSPSGADVAAIITAVAAAASVPSSSTVMSAWCTTSPMQNGSSSSSR